MGTYPSIPYQNLASQFLSFVLNKLYLTHTHALTLSHSNIHTRTHAPSHSLKNTHFLNCRRRHFPAIFRCWYLNLKSTAVDFFNQKFCLHFSKSGRIILTLTLDALGRRFWEALLVFTSNRFSWLECPMDSRIAVCLSLRHLTKSLTCYGQRVRSGLVVLLR